MRKIKYAMCAICAAAAALELCANAFTPFKARYTPDVAARRQVRGVMLSQFTVGEDDFRTIKEWGATVARYQMYPVGEKWKGKTSDTKGFAAWLDWKLGVLKGEALPLARKYGIPLVVDMHVPPGGRGGSGMKMLDDAEWADFFVGCWRKIATELKGESYVYAYDLINEPTQFGKPKVCDYLEIQRRAAEAVRSVDPTTPVIVSCNADGAWCAPSAFKSLEPLDIVNVFYQFHMYEPFEYTHQKVLPQFKDTVAVYPDASKGWDAEGLRRILAPVRKFERLYGAHIFVGEFSAVAYAKGCDMWISDVGAVLNEYGWDWCYHAFREWPGWSVEHEVTEGDSAANAKFAPSADNSRRRALLAALGAADVSRSDELQGVDTWAGIKPLMAVVNPVGREPSEDVVSLRGEWEFVTQPKAFCRRYRHTKVPFAKVDEQTPAARRSGMDRQWSEARKIAVPGAWEAQGVGKPGMSTPWDPTWDCSTKKLNNVYMGEGWYRKDVVVPAGWAGKKVWLKIGGVRSQGWFWVNKQPVAWVDNYCGTYKYDITPFVKPGETNRVVVCVNNALPSRKGLMSNVHRWGGIYRDVELEATPETRIDDAWIRGDFDAKCAEAHVTVGMAGAVRKPCLIRLTVDGRTAESAVAADGGAVVRLPLGEFRPWSPERPNLYTGVVELVENGVVVHSRRERFGVRKIEVRGGSFYLNGRPYFLRGFGDDSVYPLSGLPPADREAHVSHLRRARAAGFNFVRLHTHCEVPEYFEAADEVGVLIQAELPYYTDVPTEAFTFDPLRDLRELYAHYRRHPSFAVYCGGNEGRLGPYVGREMYAFVKRTDPDRLVIHQDGDRCEWLKYDDEEGCNDVGNSDYDVGPRDIWERGSFNTGRPFVCHEYLNLCVKQDTRLEPLYTGAWAAPDTRADRAKWLAARGLDMAWGDALHDAQHALQGVYQKRGLEWARKDPFCDGYCFWTAVDVVVANGPIHSAQGLFDPFWQTKKGGLPPERFALFNGPSCVLLDTPDDNRVFVSGDELTVDFLFAHYGEAALKDAKLKWTLCAPDVIAEGGREVGDVELGPVRKVATEKIAFPAVAKATKAVLRAEIGGTVNEWDFWLFPKRGRRDGRDIAADSALLPALAGLYEGVADAAAPSAREARVVVAPYGSKTAEEALARGQRVLTISGGDGKANVSLGWWSMGNQVGTALAKGHPALSGLPHEGVMTPLLFRVVKEGAHPLSAKDLELAAPIIVGEGRKDCYLYLGEVKRAVGGARQIAAFGLDVLSGRPESAAILDGVVDELRR